MDAALVLAALPFGPGIECRSPFTTGSTLMKLSRALTAQPANNILFWKLIDNYVILHVKPAVKQAPLILERVDFADNESLIARARSGSRSSDIWRTARFMWKIMLSSRQHCLFAAGTKVEIAVRKSAGQMHRGA